MQGHLSQQCSLNCPTPCAGRHAWEVQELMGKLYKLTGDTSATMDRLVKAIEAFAREACMAALQDATGITAL